MGEPFRLTPVAPLGSEMLLRDVRGAARELHRYPASPQGAQLQLRRCGLGVDRRAAAAALGLTASDIEDLERGRAVLASEAEWRRAEQALREAAGVGADAMR